MHISLDRGQKLLQEELHTISQYCMRYAQPQSRSNLRMENFDSSVVEAAWAYHRQIGGSHAKRNVPVEVAAFIAGACWGRHMLVAEKEEQLRKQ